MAGETKRQTLERGCGGFTLIESLMAFTALAMLSLMIAESIAGLSRTQVHQADQIRVDEVSSKFSRELRRQANYSMMIFTKGAYGDGYLAAMDTSASPILAGSRLPMLTNRGFFDRDPGGATEVGNMMFIARDADATILDLGFGDFTRINTYVFILYYLIETPTGQLDLGEWTSVRIASFPEINQVSDPMRKMSIIDELRALGIEYAWNPEQGRIRGLYRLTLSDSERLPAGDKIPPDPTRCHDKNLGLRHMRVAANGSPGITVPVYANATPGNPFPGGFEIKVDGDDNGKLMLFRLVVIGPGKSRTHAEISGLVNL